MAAGPKWRTMKLATALILSGLLALAGPAPGAPAPARQTETIQVSGKQYLRLPDWARAYDLELRWLKRDQTIQLTNKSAKLLLAVDSRDVQFNGVQVVLLFPLVFRNGTPYLSRLDADMTLRPLLSPPRSRADATIKTVCLDPGHGGREPGNCIGSNQEKKYTLLLAQEVRQQLMKAGFKVVLTRSSDTFVDLPERPEIASRRKADLFVSLHFNSVAGSQNSARGAEVYCLTPAGAPSTNGRGEGRGEGWCPGNRLNDQSMFLAYQVQKSLSRNLAVEDRGVHRARFWVLREALVPAVLVEGGFMSHPIEGKKIFDPAYRREMARAVVEGVVAYKRIVEATS
jgi:N-acetylmuramoyl-L-alanine amidase